MTPSGSRGSDRIVALSGWVLAAMVALAITHGLVPSFPSWPAGVCAWLAGALLLRFTRNTQKALLAALIGLGGLAIIFAVSRGAVPEWIHLLDANVPLLAMIASVSFLRLVAGAPGASGPDGAELPVGRRAFRHTAFSVAFLGSFINISAPILIGDRLAVEGRLSRFTSQSITRVFSGCSAWSPFFGGMAVVLTYVSGAGLLSVMLAGLPFALIGLTVVIVEAQLRYREELAVFRGYPISVSSLWVPVVLAISVAIGSTIWPAVSILFIIAIAALSVSIVVLSVRTAPAKAARTVSNHIRHGLPGMVGELLLFLGAGFLAVGLTAIVETGVIGLPMDQFTAPVAGALLAGIVAVSALGLHPVIAVAAVTPMLAPLNPSPVLLAVTYLYGWSLGTCASPLSGTHLIFQGRYGTPSFRAAMWNWPYVLLMLGVGIGLLQWLAPGG